MAGRSRAISHTTLHEAAQGHRLPSWATTAEFIKACGADPADYRGRWEAANQVVRSVSADVRVQAPLNGPSPADPGRMSPADHVPMVTDRPAGAHPDDPVDDRGVRQPAGTVNPGVAQKGRTLRFAPRRRRYTVMTASVAGAAAVIVIGASLVRLFTDDQPKSPAERHATSADCPVRQQNPAPSPPAHAGDRAAFISDITLPDCTHIARGSRVEKVWRFKNTGTVSWHGYTLHRIDLPQHRDQCQTVVDTPIPDTPPGGIVDIRTWVTAPAEQSFCFVRFKMRDGEGNFAFPGSRPLTFQLIVD